MMAPGGADAFGLGAGVLEADQQQRPTPPRHQPPVEIAKTPIGRYERLQFDPADGLLVDLPRDSAEYAAVEDLCCDYRAGPYSNRIVSIERVCNPGAYDNFWAMVEQYRLHKPNAHVYKLLHGSTADSKDSIVENNLLTQRIAISNYQRSRPYYCGDGFYFTQSFPYAASHTIKHGVPSPLRHVFVFDVLVGDVDRPPHYTNKDKIPGLLWDWKIRFENMGLDLNAFMPFRDRPLYMRYDTAQPREEGIESFAKFHESEFYPTHLITFRAGPNLTLD